MTATLDTIVVGLVGADRHGVNRYGASVARHMAQLTLDRRQVPRVEVVRVDEIGRLGPVLARSRPRSIHLHLTDNLLPGPVRDRAGHIEHLRALLDVPMVCTLHDVPATFDEPHDPGYERDRRRTYARIRDAVDRVVVCSDHERRRLEALGPSRTPCTVIPHLVDGSGAHPDPERSAGTGRRGLPWPADRRPVVGLLGFVHPGKDYASVIDACAELVGRDGASTHRIAVLGGAGDGHEAHLASLRERAAAAGVELTVTGWIPDADLPPLLDAVDLPIVPTPVVSASGSLATWLGHGRRPLVRRGPAIVELDARAPGTVTVYDPADLGAHLRAGIGAVTRTVSIPPDVGPDAVASAHLRLHEDLRCPTPS